MARYYANLAAAVAYCDQVGCDYARIKEGPNGFSIPPEKPKKKTTPKTPKTGPRPEPDDDDDDDGDLKDGAGGRTPIYSGPTLIGLVEREGKKWRSFNAKRKRVGPQHDTKQLATAFLKGRVAPYVAPSPKKRRRALAAASNAAAIGSFDTARRLARHGGLNVETVGDSSLLQVIDKHIDLDKWDAVTDAAIRKKEK